MEKKEIVQIINFINALYPNQKVTIDTMTVYVWNTMFSDYDFSTVLSAVKKIAVKKKFVPTPSEIFEMLDSVYKLSAEQRGEYFVIRINGPDETMLFKFNNKDEAEEMLGYLKSYPPIEDIRTLNNINVRDSFPYSSPYIGPKVSPARGKELRYQYENYKRRKVVV